MVVYASRLEGFLWSPYHNASDPTNEALGTRPCFFLPRRPRLCEIRLSSASSPQRHRQRLLASIFEVECLLCNLLRQFLRVSDLARSHFAKHLLNSQRHIFTRKHTDTGLVITKHSTFSKSRFFRIASTLAIDTFPVTSIE